MPTHHSASSTRILILARLILKDMGHISLDKAKAGNLGAEFFSIWVEPETNQGHFARHTFDLIDSVYEQAARHPDRMVMAFFGGRTSNGHTNKRSWRR